MTTIFDGKFLENYFRDNFSRPYARRLSYLYFGLDHSPDLFLFNNTEDIDFKYCEATQATGIIKITNVDHLQKINEWFLHCGIDKKSPKLCYFNRMMTMLSKCSWNIDKLTVRTTPDGCTYFSSVEAVEVLITRPCDTHFTLSKLQLYSDLYCSIFFTETVKSYIVPIPLGDENKLQRVVVSCEDLFHNQFLTSNCHDINLILLPGLDKPLVKNLVSKNLYSENGIRVWNDGGKMCLNYGGYYSNQDISMCVVRDNIYVFPKTIKER